MDAFARTLSIAVATCGCLWLASCQSRDGEPDADTMAFNVDTVLVSSQVVDTTLGLSYRHPVSWQPLTSDEVQQLSAAIGDVGSVKMQPVSSYKDSSEAKGLIVSRLIGVDKHGIDSALRQINGPLPEGASARFSHNRIEFRQTLISKPGLTLFRLAFQNRKKKWLLLDIFTRTQGEVYRGDAKTFESVIGSVQIL